MANNERPMYKAVCANCGKQCEVPFKPSGDRPVYCKDCFRARSEGGGAPKQGGARASALPRPSTPVQKGGAGGQAGSLSGELATINEKLDRLLFLVGSGGSRAKRGGAPAKKKVAPRKKGSRGRG